MFFLNCYYISFQEMESFLGFFVSVINHYHVNGSHLSWDSFEWFSLQISCDAKYFFLSRPRHGDQELIVVIINYFQIWKKNNKKTKHNIIINRVISSHMGPMYIETSYILHLEPQKQTKCLPFYVYLNKICFSLVMFLFLSFKTKWLDTDY